MNGYAEGESIPGDAAIQAENARRGFAHTSAGTFPLRRARYFSETGTPLLNAALQPAHTNLVQEIDAGTKHQLIVENLRMVVSIARRYANRGLDMVDLVRAGNQGLIHAMERFEPEGGFCFSTFVTWCISQKIELALITHRSAQGSAAQPTMESLDMFDDTTLNCPKKRLEYRPAG